MLPHRFKYICLLTFSFLLFTGVTSYAQEEGEGRASEKLGKGKRFHVGLNVGTFFANKSTAGIYDGYGIAVDGTKNDFANSAINRKINFEYGGGNGFPDQIAPLLGVNHGDWQFDETDMPINLKYNPAVTIGLDLRYCLSKRNSIILNMIASNLTVNGDFTITITNPSQVMTSPDAVNYRTFSIIGGEQRLISQLGYQRLLGDLDKFNFFIEAGLTLNMSKFKKNMININGLVIDLTTYYNQYGYVDYRQRNLTGIGLGGFAGFGANLSMSAKWTLQLLYNPSFDQINLGPVTNPGLQHNISMRAYYNL